jgi:hypothetical protein
MKNPVVVCTVGSALLAPFWIIILSTVATFLLALVGIPPDLMSRIPFWARVPLYAIALLGSVLMIRDAYRWLFRHCHERVS